MDCKEFKRLISDYISDQLDYHTLKQFCSHMDRCEDCREELVIQFLVTEGIQRLEDGRAFDLQRELDQRLEESKKKIKVHDMFMRAGIVLEAISAGVLAGFILWILL